MRVCYLLLECGKWYELGPPLTADRDMTWHFPHSKNTECSQFHGARILQHLQSLKCVITGVEICNCHVHFTLRHIVANYLFFLNFLNSLNNSNCMGGSILLFWTIGIAVFLQSCFSSRPPWHWPHHPSPACDHHRDVHERSSFIKAAKHHVKTM